MTQTLKPENEDQVADTVAWAVSEETPVEIVAGGTKRGYGRPLQTAYTLDLGSLSGITLYEPEELVLSAGPGTSMVELEHALADQDQQLAFEPADLGPLLGAPADSGTLGGAIACNLSGPRRISAGAARDHLLGLRGVSGRGETFKTGGRVMKNVTGYDLCKLMTGSFGTLAAFTQITIKVLPRPKCVRTITLTGLTEAQASRAMSEALQSSHDVSAAAHLPASVAGRIPVDRVRDAGASITAVRVEGFKPSAVHRCAALRNVLAGHGELDELHTENSRQFWRAVRDVRPFWPDENDKKSVWRISVAPTAGHEIAGQILDKVGGEALFDWGGGLVWLALADPAVESVRATVDQAGGHATLVRAAEPVRAAAAVFQPQPETLANLSHRIKEAFDPKGILNPGRMAMTG